MASMVKSSSLGSLCRAKIPRDQKSMALSKVNSCAYITLSNFGLSAHPFYFRTVDNSCADSRLSSTYQESWSSFVYKNRPACTLGSDRKPLVPYDPNHQRSRMALPKVKSLEQGEVDRLIAEPKGKNLKTKRESIFKTIYMDSYEHPARCLAKKKRVAR